jgi:hypothetical protein
VSSSRRGRLTVAALLAGLMGAPALAANPIEIENARPGTSAWQITLPAGTELRCAANNSCSDTTRGEPAIEGYAWPTSVGHEEVISFYVNTREPRYSFTIYRLGWYGGAGGREILKLHLEGTAQSLPTLHPLTGRIECEWENPFTLMIPSSWVTGVYLVKLTADSSGRESYIPFVVRSERHSPLLVQCSVTTWQAYNCWGGKSLYEFNSLSCDRASEVSFVRPYANGDGAGELFYFEINLIRWLEREGYDIGYCTNLDIHDGIEQIANHLAFMSQGHDEYWSNAMRDHVEQARNSGVNLAFLTANACYWQVRLEPASMPEAPLGTMVCYKESWPNYDPYAWDGDETNDSLLTVRWRSAPVNKPEARLIGIMFDNNFVFAPPSNRDIVITNPSHWLFEGTGAEVGTVLPGLLGNEMDRCVPGVSPPDLEILAESPIDAPAAASPFSHMALHVDPESQAMVFATGTLQWSWGLDDYRGFFHQTPRVSEVARQMTRNLLARFMATPPALGVDDAPVTAPRAWPVPFTPGRAPLRVRFATATDSPDAPRVYDIAGRPVVTLERSRDTREISWDGRDFSGRAVTPGIYWVTAGRERVRVVVTR